jgi:signal transduction histidine kinase
VVSFVVFQWPEMAIGGVLASAMAIDSHAALRTERTAFAPTLLFDIALTGAALTIVGVHPIAMASATAYFVVLVAVLGRAHSAWVLGAFAIAVGVVSPFLRSWVGLSEPSTTYLLVSGVGTVAVFSYAMMYVITRFAALIRERMGDEERRVRLAGAVAEASTALVAQDDPEALHIAVDAIRRALGASVVFVEQNVEDPDAGLCAVVAESAGSTQVLHETFERGARTPWANLPGARSHLTGGAPFFFRVEEAAGTAFDRHGIGGVASEVDVPVIVNGVWVGVVGAGDINAGRRWGTDDLVMLRTLADLTAAFWQRIEDLRARDSLIGSLDGRLRYEEALARSSKFLLAETGVEVADALESVGVAANVDEVFITRTIPVDGQQPSALSVASWVQPGLQPDRPVESTRSYSDMPLVIDAVNRGAIARVTEGDASELVVGIEVSGGWYGTVGFLRHTSSQPWSKRDATFLRTIGDILGAYYERAQTRHHLESSISSKDQLIASVSHELRTPLTAVVGLAEELEADAEHIPREERDQLIGVIARESREMVDLVEDLLIAARSDESLIPVFPQRTDLALLAESVVRRISIPSDVRVTITDNPSAAYADPVRVRQVIRNLLTNAIRYGGKDVEVAVGVNGRSSYIEVSDDGAGIPHRDRARIFEPYGRSGSTDVVPGSVGLGLALSRRLAVLMGGALEYVPNGRCTFRLTVPTAPDAADA